MQRLTFKRVGDKGASKALADANAKGQVKVATAASLLNFPKAIQLLPIRLPKRLPREEPSIVDAAEHYQRADLEVLGEPIERRTQILVGSKLLAKNGKRDQKLGGDIIYISSKNSVFAGPNNIAYSATKADQAHQVRLLAVELGEHGIRVNGINPDGVVRGSGIFASGWGANRAATYGVAEEDLGQFYANRTILKREVVPENVADAVYVLTGPELSRTTGLHIPVDSGVAAAFLR